MVTAGDGTYDEELSAKIPPPSHIFEKNESLKFKKKKKRKETTNIFLIL
jgi:hypothetical protein